jgi:hypothetical protein
MLEQQLGVPRRRAGYAIVCNLEWIFLPLERGSQDPLTHVSRSGNEKPVRPSTVLDRQYWIVGANIQTSSSPCCLNQLTKRVAVIEINVHSAGFRPLPWGFNQNLRDIPALDALSTSFVDSPMSRP